MNDVLKTVLSLSFSASLLILILLLGKPLLKDRVSRGWQYYIWLVVIARLLLPFAPEVNLVGALFGQMENKVRHEEFLQSTTVAVSHKADDMEGEGQSVLENMAEDVVLSGQKGQTVPAGVSILQNLWLVWIGVALLFFIRKVTIYQSFVQYIRAGWQEAADIALLERMGEIEIQMGIKRPVELCTNSLISSPLLIGFFHPCIILPTADLPEEEFGYIIRHELLHYKRRDMLYKWLVQAVICLHWFNPLIYLMEREISRACELACDEAVMGMLDASGRRAYGDTLLHAMGTGGSYKDSLASLTLNESAELLKERLGAIMNFRKIARGKRLCSLLLAAVFAAGAAGTGAYAGPAGKEAFDTADASFRYTQEGYYQAPYLFEIGWNVKESAGDIYAGAEVSLDDGSRMEVFYTDQCDEIWEDDAVINALSILLTRLKSENAGTEFPLTRPLVVRVENIGNEDPMALARQYYQGRDIAQYTAVFTMLTEKEQDSLLLKSYEEDQISLFAAAAGRLDEDSKLIKSYAEKAYSEKEAAFFSVLMGRMSPAALEEWAARAEADGRSSFRAMLLDAAGQEDEKEVMEEELDARRLEEYRAHGITEKDGAYYYQGEMVRILLDARPDGSLVTLEQNPEGTVDIRITRNESEEIESVRALTEEEREELFGAEEEEPNTEATVRRMKKEELPESVIEAMQSCAIKTWYLICDSGQQYIYYNGFAWEYAYEPVRLKEGWELRIEPLRKKSSGYLLIMLSDEAPVTVICNGEEILPEKVENVMEPS